tara:strand:+ start:578 stop:763 length:186 start_codon:yes stop_codon:yes gene_type:complete
MTKTEYDELKEAGMLYELFPKATGDFDKDCDYVFVEEIKHEKNKRVPGNTERFMNPYDKWE